MEENVALDTSKQKQFVKSIKGIKKLIKKAEVDVPESVVPKAQDEKKSKRKRPERGLVYLSHIPHGFYEHEMTQYFKQFGAVSNVRVIRSKRTGNSKGFAFVEFKQPAVAEIVAETMNNYLMGKRLIKAAYVPPEKQKPRAMRKHWNRLNNPGRTERLKHIKAYNENKDHAGEIARARKTLSTYEKNMKRLSDLGINYDFFTPVDVPEELLKSKDSKTAKVESISKKKDAVQKDSKKKLKINESKAEKKEPVKQQKTEVKAKKVSEPVVNKKEQKQKQNKLKEAGVKPPESFIQVQEDDDSDSSADFDSDDYNKALENDSDVESGEDDSGDESDPSADDSDASGDESDQEDDEVGSEDEFEITGSDDDDSEDEEIEEVPPPILLKKGKSKGPIAPPAAVSSKKQAMHLLKALQEKQSKSSKQKGQKAKQVEKLPEQKVPKVPETEKRKAPQKNAVSPKKPKFEKQTQQPMKKQFKKKK